jgi:crotonobetainyl-CoA:carnitine CoA-transferase CaiB-like acyl-CoA transferase
VFACAGHETWLAIAACSDPQWQALARIIGGDALAGDPRFAGLAGRKANEDEVEATVAAWAREQDLFQAEAMLQAHGIAAHVVATAQDFASDPQIAALGHLIPQPEPRGRVPVVEASRFRLSDTPARLDRSAPHTGRDTLEILRTFAGYDDEHIAALTQAGVLR